MSVDMEQVFLRLYPDSILSQKCVDIDPNDPDLPAVLDKMIAIMYANEGAGLAAPQVGLNWNVFIVSLGGDSEPRALVNPRIEEFGENTCKSKEGCLSLPGIMAKLEDRYESITVSTCLPKQEERMNIQLFGAEAVVFQHEYDHLQGKTLFDRMKPVQKMMAKKKYLKTKAKHAKLLQDFTRLRIKKEQLQNIVKMVEEQKHGTENQSTTDVCDGGSVGDGGSPSGTTAGAAESSPVRSDSGEQS
jgi:peptide deformylase